MQRMTKRRALYTAHPQATPAPDAVHEDTQPPAQEPPAQGEPVYSAIIRRKAAASAPEETPNAFHIAPGWIDAQDRTRTWNLMDKNGGKLAEICTKRDAAKLANILNRVREANVGRGR